MLRRSAYTKLKEWKDNSQKALCIIGARQIGKTTLVREFARENFQYYVEINFLIDKKACEIFEENLDADTIITRLTAYVKKEMVPGETLVLLDEIQECPEARTAIKALIEDGRFRYIETGSQLGINYKKVRSYPVGFEEIYYMYPMSFMEYMWAAGVQDSTVEYLEKCFAEKKAVDENVNSTILSLFRTYMVVGGMPDVVNIYVKTHDIGKVVNAQNELIELYKQDIAQYAEGRDKIKIRSIYESIPSQLNDKNRRFILASIDENARTNRYEKSFLWLANAGVAMPCYNVAEPQESLEINSKRNLFKLYMGDTGLLCAASMSDIQFELLNGNVQINMGSILENAMAQELTCHGYPLRYFDSKKYGEIDFVLPGNSNPVILEIKSGNESRSHNALKNVLEVKNWKFEKAYVFSKENVRLEGNIEYYPWYMIMFLHRRYIPKNTVYEVDLSALNSI